MSTPLPLPNPPENVLFRLGQVGAHPLHLLADGAHLPLKVAAALTIPTRHLPALAAAAAPPTPPPELPAPPPVAPSDGGPPAALAWAVAPCRWCYKQLGVRG